VCRDYFGEPHGAPHAPPFCRYNEAEDQDNVCTDDEFYDVVTYSCDDKIDTFVTDDSVAQFSFQAAPRWDGGVSLTH